MVNLWWYDEVLNEVCCFVCIVTVWVAVGINNELNIRAEQTQTIVIGIPLCISDDDIAVGSIYSKLTWADYDIGCYSTFRYELKCWWLEKCREMRWKLDVAMDEEGKRERNF